MKDISPSPFDPTPAAADTSADTYRERALVALRQKRFDLVERLPRSTNLEARELIENLRVIRPNWRFRTKS